MIRVLHSISNMDRAGIETMVMNFYRHMDPSVVRFDFLANKSKPGDYEEEIAAMGGRVYRSPGYNPLKFPAYARHMRRIFQENPDMRVLHVHNGALGIYALAAGKLCGVKNRVYHAHGTRLPEGKGRAVKALLKPFIDCFAVWKLACGTDAARFYYHAKTVRENRYTLVHNAIDVKRFCFDEAARERMRSEHGLSGCDVIGHVGRFSAQKNHARILTIFQALRAKNPRARLVLIGEGDTKPDILRRVNEMGLEGDVLVMPSVGDVERWYQAMDAFLLPSIWEGLPVVAIEAQATGLPCVMSTAVTREARVTELARFVSLSDGDDRWADELADCLRAEAPRRGRAEQMRAAGYDIEIEAKKLQDFYVKICG